MKSRVTVLDVRRVNRAQVLALLFFNGPLTRPTLGQSTGLSVASVASVVGDLVDEGLIVEAGTDKPEGGRPRVRVAVNPSFGTVLGVDISQTMTSVGAFDLSMREIGRADVTLHPAECTVEATVESVAAAIAEVLARLPNGTPPVLGLGVGVPGLVFHGAQTLVMRPTSSGMAFPSCSSCRKRPVCRFSWRTGSGPSARPKCGSGPGAGHGTRRSYCSTRGSVRPYLWMAPSTRGLPGPLANGGTPRSSRVGVNACAEARAVSPRTWAAAH